MVLTVAVFATVPSAVFLDAVRDYYRFVTGWNPEPLKRTQTRGLPHDGRPEPELSLRFVEFALRAPEASRVGLAGSFNGWDPNAHPMSRAEDGEWSIVVPLPPGEYRYAFSVDGELRADPAASGTARRGDADVSVREVR